MSEDLLSTIKELEEKLRLLELENSLLADNSEDILLFGSITESITELSEKAKIFESALEKISIIKNIPYCAFGRLVDEKFIIDSEFALFSEDKSISEISVSSSLKEQLIKDDIIVKKYSKTNSEFNIRFNKNDFSLGSFLIISYDNLRIKNGIFICVDKNSEVRLEAMKNVIKHAVTLINSRLDNLFLMEQLAKQNEILELKLDERMKELKKRNDDLRKSEGMYRTLFEKSNDAIFLVEKDTGRYLSCNKAAQELAGRTIAEIKKLTTHDITYQNEEERLELISSEINPIDFGEVNFFRPDGSYRTALLSTVPLDEKIVFGIAHDITKRIKAQQLVEDMLANLEINTEELKNKNKELEEARKSTLNLIEDLELEIEERTRIEKNLKESEEKHRLISDLTSDYLFHTKISEDKNQDMVWVSGSFQKITGYTLEEYKAVGSWCAAIHPDDIHLDEEAFEKIKRNEKATVELRTYHKDGSIVWMRSHGSPIWDEENNRLIGVIGAVKDITEEKQNQIIQQIQYNIANASVTATTTKDLISVVKNELSQMINTKDLFIAFYNQVSGMFKIEVYEDSMDKIETWKAEKSVSGYVMKMKKSILLRKNEILELTKTGEIDIIGTLPEIWLGIPLRIGEKIIGIIAAQSYDNPKAFNSSNVKAFEIITNQLALFIERKRAEEDTIRLSRATIQSPASVVITDYNGTIEYVNPKFTEVTGYSLKEAVGQNPRIVKSGEHPEEFYKDMWETILSGKNWKGNFHNRKKNGELYWENAIISPIVNEDGKITHFVAIKEDITEKKKMLEELITAKEKAEASEKIKTEFLAQMSHEIRSPLNVILNFVSLIKEEVGDNANEDIQFGFESIDSSSKRIIRTIDLILNMTDLQTGAYETVIREFDAAKSLNLLATEYKHYAAVKNIELKQNFDFTTFNIRSDEYAFTQIFGNLIDNAIKYTKEGYVEVKALHRVDNKLIVSISDTGIGMSKEFLPKLFSTFTQEEQGYTRSYEGNGLGLALVKRYCDLINAEISVESEKGKGTTFSVVISDQLSA